MTWNGWIFTVKNSIALHIHAEYLIKIDNFFLGIYSKIIHPQFCSGELNAQEALWNICYTFWTSYHNVTISKYSNPKKSIMNYPDHFYKTLLSSIQHAIPSSTSHHAWPVLWLQIYYFIWILIDVKSLRSFLTFSQNLTEFP